MNANPTTTGTATVRDRNRSSGAIGCAPRACAATKPASATAAITKAATTRGAAKPAAPASIAPYVSPPIAITAVTCPAQSNRAARCGDGRTRASSSSVTAPAGTLMTKISRQLTTVSTPPSSGPEDEATAPPIAHTATARARRTGSGYACPISAIDDGIITAATAPWTNRAPTSAPMAGASPHAAEAATNTASPAPNTRRAPNRSANDPADSSSAANISVYPVDHPLQPGEPPAQPGPDGRQRHVHHHRVQGDHEEAEHRGGQRETRAGSVP